MLSPKTALALLLLTSMVSAGDFHGRHAVAGNILGARNGIMARQEGGEEAETGAGAAAQETSAPPAPPQTSEPAPPPSTSAAPPPPSTSAPPPSTPSDPPATSATPDPSTTPTPPAPVDPSSQTTAPAPPQTSEPQEQSTVTRKQTSQAPIETVPPQTTSTSKKAEPTTLFSTQQYTTLIVTKGADGAEFTSTRVEETLVPTATAAPIDDTPKTETGMSKQTKTTVIGVVCGVGGAIVLAAVFFLWWKWSSRRKQRAALDDGDELVGMNAFQPSGMGSTSEKAGGGQAGLFTNNLESYHAPGAANQRPANAGTNF